MKIITPQKKHIIDTANRSATCPRVQNENRPSHNVNTKDFVADGIYQNFTKTMKGNYMITDMARKHPSNPQEDQDYLDVIARFERLKVEAEAQKDYDLLAKITQILKSLKVNNPKPKVIRSAMDKLAEFGSKQTPQKPPHSR